MAVGRKDKWEQLNMQDKLILVEKWARDGATDKQIMDNLGIGHNLFYKWKKDKKEFEEALKNGKEIIDTMVENTLLKNALGYRYKEEVVTNKGTVVEVEKYEKPSVTAQIFWLKNRLPDRWRDKRDINHEGEITNKNIDLSHLTLEELRELASKVDG